MQVGGSGFGARSIVLGHKGLGHGIGGGGYVFGRTDLRFGGLIGPGHKNCPTKPTPKKREKNNRKQGKHNHNPPHKPTNPQARHKSQVST